MNKLLCTLLTMICLIGFTGCGTIKSPIQFKPQTELIIAKVTALEIASEYAYKYPYKVDKAVDFCDMLLESDTNFESLFKLGKAELVKSFGNNPTRQASLLIILDSVVIEGKFDLKVGKDVVESFKNGLLLRK